ncbi:hypothetical protein DdX_14278 [Ditylenchus destructor]|uniref:Uncharacterized protein n=1 Tax=Ditylenchus destructor TaxID=166010 RepID=A0AAD4R1V0_9BILA|nr:hypothetical protein DdX_14278 [Ditylenchus destructor]
MVIFLLAELGKDGSGQFGIPGFGGFPLGIPQFGDQFLFRGQQPAGNGFVQPAGSKPNPAANVAPILGIAAATMGIVGGTLGIAAGTAKLAHGG